MTTQLIHDSVPFIAIGQIIAISHTQRTTDKTWARATQSLWEMVVICFSVICAVVPRSQQFWGGFKSGGLRIADTRGSNNKAPSNGRSKQRFQMNNWVWASAAAQSRRASGESQRPLHAENNRGITRTIEISRYEEVNAA